MRFAMPIWRPCVVRAMVLGLLAALTVPGFMADIGGSGASPGAFGPGAFGPGTFGQAAAQSTTSRRQAVTVRGNRRIEVETILSYMALPTNRQITAEDLNAAVRRLFDTGLFSDVQMIPSADQLVVEVVENPSINVIAFEGNDLLKDEDLEKLIRLRARLPFTRSGAEADAQSIIEIYRRTGRYGAQVEPVIIERPENRVDLVFEIDEGEVTEVSAIKFVGNEKFSNRKLRGVIDTAESGMFSSFFSSDVYDPDRLELDKELLRQFYLSRGYADFTVLSATAELSPDRSGFFITFTVDEGEEYAFGTMDVVVTARGLDPEEFRAALPGGLEGDTYDSREVERIVDKLTDLAGQKGFAFVQVQPRADKNNEERIVNVTFELVEGSRIFVERIDIVGNGRTLDRVIRREMRLVEGDAFNTRKIRLSRAKIRGLQYFSSVELDTTQGSAEDRAVLTIRVQEKSTGSLSLGLGFSSSSGPIGNVAIVERNFLGRGQILNATVTAAGDTQVYDLSFTEPRFLDRDLSVAGRVFFVQDDRSDTSSFDQNSTGFGPSVGFPLSENLRLRLRYNFLFDDIFVAGNASPAIQADDGTRITSSLGYTLSFDKRNDPVEPTRGYYLSFNQELAGLGGSGRFVKSRATAKTWRGFFEGKVVASFELEAGSLFSFTNDSRVTERYFLGGDRFRGFADEGVGPRDLLNGNDALGGNYYSMARFEVSFPLGLPEELGIFGGAFIDAGTLWGLDTTSFGATGTASATTIDDGSEFRISAGALMFLDTPFGPLQLSFAVPLIKESYDETEFFRLTIGTRF